MFSSRFLLTLRLVFVYFHVATQCLNFSGFFNLESRLRDLVLRQNALGLQFRYINEIVLHLFVQRKIILINNKNLVKENIIAPPGNRTRVERMGIFHDTTTPAALIGNCAGFISIYYRDKMIRSRASGKEQTNEILRYMEI